MAARLRRSGPVRPTKLVEVSVGVVMACAIFVLILAYRGGLSRPEYRDSGLEVRRERQPQEAPIAGGEVRLPAGLTVQYAYHFDRNALADARRSGDWFVALTESGNLLSFDASTLRLEAERTAHRRFVCLGEGADGEVLAGQEDGRIVRVDPASLDVTSVADVEGTPAWIASRPGGPVLAAIRRDEVSGDAIHDLGSGRRYTVDDPAVGGVSWFRARLVDRRGRLWLGVDKGEWGGWCGWLDLDSGRLGVVGETDYGVYGFVELAGGDVWAYGGTLHFRPHGRFIARVGSGMFHFLASDGKKPPVTHVVQDPATGTIWILSFDGLYRAAPDLKVWTKVYEPRGRYHWAPLDAMGEYPTVTGVYPGDGLVLATLRDGFITLKEGVETHHPVEGQLELRSVERILTAAEGIVLCARDEYGHPWRLRDGKWTELRLLPPFEPEPHSWHEQRVLVDDEGALLTITRAGTHPGPVVTMRWRGDTGEVIASEEEGTVSVRSAFNTPDGRLWMASDRELRSLVAGVWKRVGRAPKGLAWDRDAVGDTGPPWLVLDRGDHRLLRLTTGPEPQLAVVELRDVQVFDAIPWDGGDILLATNGGLRLLRGGALESPALPSPQAQVVCLCRDGRGRLWMGGEGLWLLDGETLHSLMDLDALPSGRVEDLAGDPEHPDGVVVALGSRGVLYVRAAP